MNVYVTNTKKPKGAGSKDRVYLTGSFDPGELADEVGTIDGVIYIDDLTVLCEKQGKTLNWDKSWPIIDALLKGGNSIIFTAEKIELTSRDGPVYDALKGVYEAMEAMGNKRGEKYKQSMLVAGGNSGGWIMPDDSFLKQLANKVRELGVKDGCAEMNVSRQTYYRWKRAGKF